MYRWLLLLVLLALAAMLGACKQAAPAPTATPQAGSNTAGQLAEQGKTVYARSCARCHGDRGQGGSAPALTGERTSLNSYGDAQKLFEKISTTMPPSAPGSLSQEEYINVLAFLLVEDDLVQPDATISPDALSGIEVR